MEAADTDVKPVETVVVRMGEGRERREDEGRRDTRGGPQGGGNTRRWVGFSAAAAAESAVSLSVASPVITELQVGNTRHGVHLSVPQSLPFDRLRPESWRLAVFAVVSCLQTPRLGAFRPSP